KILYISSDPIAAQAAAGALQMGPDVVVSVQTRLQDAAHWIFNNLDVAALILDEQFGRASCAAFLKHLRGRCLTAPAIFVVSEESSTNGIAGLGIGQNDCVVMRHPPLPDLGAAVQRAIEADRTKVMTRELWNLHRQLEEMRACTDRLFDEYPLPLCQCGHDAVITRANGAFAALFGCPSATKKRGVELASDLFNSSQELAWLIERSV